MIYRRGRIWWGVVYKDARGRKVRESLKTASRQVAERRLAQLQRARHRGQYQTPRERRVDVAELLDDLVVNLDLRGLASAPKAKSHVGAVRRDLGHVRAAELDTATVERTQAAWIAEGVAPATVNRRSELLRQAYRLATRRTPPKVPAAPHVPMLKVDNARQGFLSRADFDALVQQLVDDDVRDFVEWSYWTGFRPGESRQLTWAMLDRDDWTLTLSPHAAKTRRGRVVAVEGPLRDIVERRLTKRRLDCPLIFHRVAKGRPGQPIQSFRKAWAAAVRGAGLAPGLTPYDLRRTAVRNMVRAGVPRDVAMRITGHETDATFRRYNIVATDDLREAVRATAAWVAEQPRARKVRGTIGAQSTKRRRANR